MAHFVVETNADGSVSRILKDGVLIETGLTLEQHFSVARTYFVGATQNLHAQRETSDPAERRLFGLQTFLLALTGFEAFTNTYSRQRADDLNRSDMIARIEQKHGSVTKKFTDLLELSGDEPIDGQDDLIEKLWGLVQFRHELVHPRWEPASMSLPGAVGLQISGLVDNRQKVLEDYSFCEEALNSCLLLVARVGQTQTSDDGEAYLLHWTGRYGLTASELEKQLELPDTE